MKTLTFARKTALGVALLSAGALPRHARQVLHGRDRAKPYFQRLGSPGEAS
jgi:hypothetical protein